jgi:PAS domain S-box-containing protein
MSQSVTRNLKDIKKDDSFYEAFFNSSNEGFCILKLETDDSGIIINLIFHAVNSAFLNNTGLTNVTGKTVKVVLPDLYPSWIAILQSVYNSGQPQYHQSYVQDTERWFSTNFIRVGEKENALTGIIFRDITSGRKAEEALQQSEQRMARVFEALPVGVGFYNTGGGFYMVNPEIQRYLPNNKMPSKDSERGWRWHAWDNNGNAVNPDDFPGARALRGETVQPGIEMLYTHDDNIEVWTSVAAVPVRDNERVIGALVTITDIDNQKRALEALQKRETMLAAIQEIGGVAGIDIDIQNSMVGNRTPEYRKLHGLPETTTHETHAQWLARLHPDDRKEAEKTLLDALNGKKDIYSTEYRIIRPYDGQVRWIYAKADIHRNTEGQPVRLLGAHIDITAQKAMEKAVRESEAFLAAIFSEAAVGLSVINTSGQFLRINDTLCRLLGRPREELLSLSVLDVTAPDYITPSLEALEQLLATGHPVTLDKQYIQQGGSLIWANSTLSLLDTAAPEPTIIIVTADLTERKKAEETLKIFNARLENMVAGRTVELQENKELLQATLNSTHEMIQVFKAVRLEGEVVDFVWMLNNKTSEAYYGDVIGKSLLENNPGVVEAGIFQSFKEVVNSGIPQHYEKRYNYEQFNGWFYQSVVKMDDGVVVYTANISDRKKAEQEIINLNKTLVANNRELASLHSELATFNNIAAKDYKDTLETLYVYLEHVIKSDALKISNSGKSNLRRAQSAIQKLKLLTEDMIAFSNIRHLDQGFSQVDLAAVFEGVLNDLAFKIEQSNATVLVEGTLPKIDGFPLLLSLLFNHLLDNALKFTSKDRDPVVVVSSRQVTRPGAPEVLHEISFKDNGIGFPENERDNIFEIFYRLHEKKDYRGSGIGLAVCRKIIDMHGGFITALGNPGKGASFCCYFPVNAI